MNNLDFDDEMSVEDQISELRGLFKNDTGQLKAAIKAVHKELKTSNTNMKSSFHNEIDLLHRMTLELHDLVQRKSSSEDENIKSSSSSETTTSTTKAANDVENNNQDNNNNNNMMECFSQALGPVPDPTEQRLQQIEHVLALGNPPPEHNLLSSEDKTLSTRRASARFLNISSAVGDQGDEEEFEQDCYSLFIISPIGSIPFCYSIFVACFQFFITMLILVDLLVDDRPEGVQDENIANVPSKVRWPVWCAQFVSLLIALVTVDDMITSMKMLIIGYDKNSIEKCNPAASHCKFILANLTRFLMGFGTVLVSSVIVVQSTEVLEIFMNFAAVAFVSELDNIAFGLAEDGLCGETLQEACERVVDIKVKVQRRNKGWLVNVLFASLFLPFLFFLLFIRVRQKNGFILANTSCKRIDIHFGDEIYDFHPSVKFNFEGEGINKTLANSDRWLPFMEEHPSPLVYQYFSGTYVAEEEVNNPERLEEFNVRPVYWERGVKDPTSGKIYYCDAIMSWVFTIEALYDTPGAIEDKAKEECQWGWLMQSPVTDALTLEDAPMTNWNVWTGTMQFSTLDFRFRCAECERDSDCGLTHGTCDRDNGICNCHENWQGKFCHVPKPYCPAIIWLDYGPSSYEYSEIRPYTIILDDVTGEPFEMNERPVYVTPYNESILEVIMYTGERWFDTFWGWQDIGAINAMEAAGAVFHSYWDNVLQRSTKYYSDRTRNSIPTGFTWHEIQDSRAQGNFGLFGASFPVNARFECLDVDCFNRPNICGEYGECVKGMEPPVANFSESFPRNQCQCKENFGGYFCEHSPYDPYARDMYHEFLTNPKKAPNITESPYWKYFLNEKNDAVEDEDEEL